MDAAVAFPINSAISVASVTLGATTVITGGANAFKDVQVGMVVTKSSGTGSLSAGTTVSGVSADLTAVTLNQAPATTGTATLSFTSNGAAVGPVNANGFVWLHGITLRETAGSTASVTLREGSATGKIVAEYGLTANTAVGSGLLAMTKVNSNIFCVINGGSVAGVLYLQ